MFPIGILSPVLSRTEQALVGHLVFILSSLPGYLHQFQNAIALYNHANALLREGSVADDPNGKRMYAGWCMMAARDGALTIYHFGITLKACRDQVQLCLTLRQFLDLRTMRLAIKLYDANFPRADRIRHAIGHAADMIATPDDLFRTWEGKRATNPPKIFTFNSLADRRFQTMHDGEVMSFELSETTLKKLDRIYGLVVQAFTPIEAAMREFQGPWFPPGQDQNSHRSL